MAKLFISYSRKNIDIMLQLKGWLEQTGIEVWIDENLYPGTPDWQMAIEEALRECQGVAVILSPEAYTSKWVRLEINEAESLNKPIFPLLVKGKETNSIPLILRNHQFVDLRNNFPNGLEELIPQFQFFGWLTSYFEDNTWLAMEDMRKNRLLMTIFSNLRKDNLKKLFVGRKDILGKVESELHSLFNGHNAQNKLYFFTGVALIGKTTILNQIRNIALSRYNIASILIDFDLFLAQSPYSETVGILDILKIFIDRLDITIHESIDITNWKDVCIQAVLDLGFPIVFMFDNISHVPHELFEQIQDLTDLLIQKGNYIFFYTDTEAPNKTNLNLYWSIKSQMYLYHLEPFTESQSLNHIAGLLSGYPELEIPSPILPYTGGIPGNNEEFAYDYIVGLEFSDLLRLSLLKVVTNRLIDYLVNEISWWDKNSNWDKNSKNHGMHRLRSLLKSPYFEWSPDGYGYRVIPEIRKILENYLRKINPQEHLRIHIACFNFYQYEIQIGDYLGIPEQIFHLAGANYDVAQYGNLSFSLPSNMNQKFLGNNMYSDILKKGLAILESSKLEPSKMETILSRIIRVFQDESYTWYLTQTELDNLVRVCEEQLNNLY